MLWFPIVYWQSPSYSGQMNDLEDEIEQRPVTYTLWNQSMSNMETKGWHPITFRHADAGPQQIRRIKV